MDTSLLIEPREDDETVPDTHPIYTNVQGKRAAEVPLSAVTSSPPAKRQSKWAPEEDALIMKLRQSGMKWNDIAKKLPGRSSISCRLHYQNYLEKRPIHDPGQHRRSNLQSLSMTMPSLYSFAPVGSHADGSTFEGTVLPPTGQDIVQTTEYRNMSSRRASPAHSFASYGGTGSTPPLLPASTPPLPRRSSGLITPPPLSFRDDSPPKASTYTPFERLARPIPSIPLPQTEYTYSRLASDQIRLLKLLKGRADDPMHCQLTTVTTNGLRESTYHALSYAWGDSITMEDIFLQHSNDGTSASGPHSHPFPWSSSPLFKVRSNLFLALKRLRSAEEDIYFWVDAICINQTDDVEKSHQLPKMLDIYSNAESVCIWLGDDENAAELGTSIAANPIDFIPQIVNLRSFDRILSVDTSMDSLKSIVSFANLLTKPWFRRRWVIQEVSASRAASVHYGSKKINWIDFADAVQLLQANLDRIRAIYNSSEFSKRDPDALSHLESAGATAIVQASINVLQKMDNGQVVTRLWGIEKLVTMFHHFEASDSRDTIYALLSLASDGHMSTESSVRGLVPDYTMAPLEVYAEFVRYCVESGRSLDIICRHWALPLRQMNNIASLPVHCAVTPPPRSHIPSWIGLVTESSFGPPSHFTRRMNGDSLVGAPGRRIYNASLSKTADARFSALDGLCSPRSPHLYFHHWQPPEGSLPNAGTLLENNNTPNESNAISMFNVALSARPTLYAKGICLGRVTEVSSRVVDGTVPVESLRMAGWSRSMGVDNIPDRLWKTLVADRDSQGERPPTWWRRACMHCLTRLSSNGDLNTSKLLENMSVPKFAVDFLKRVQSVVWNRKFFVVRSLQADPDWRYGFGSSDVNNDDMVCILFGCSVPVVLRRKNGKGDTILSDEQFSLVGEAYIHGGMDGELLASVDRHVIETATLQFAIV
ncbi:HET-domain-containing protein [Lepidopterella palustris CBS 459.81]|uniref:HET-domain-containing protein n=1 Tax=Lepidopterella palustris CBS 459.81 TaxID=1314670 RepID=A0A8E2E4T6_9PEZI|nr:HET-domain-containing protein [Lepidopterella palustris CBS 459.81]